MQDEVPDEAGPEYDDDADDDFLPPLTLMTQQRSVTYGDLVDGNNQKITCISEVPPSSQRPFCS